MYAIGQNPNKGFLKTLIGAVLAALLLAASPAPASALTAPTLSAEAGNRYVRLAWTESAYATAYEWRMSTDGGASWGGWTGVPDNAFREKGGRVPGLSNGTAYTFQVRAVKQTMKFAVYQTITLTEHSDPSNAVTATPTPTG